MFKFLIKENIIYNNIICLLYKNNPIRKFRFDSYIITFHKFSQYVQYIKKKKLKNKKSISF